MHLIRHNTTGEPCAVLQHVAARDTHHHAMRTSSSYVKQRGLAAVKLHFV